MNYLELSFVLQDKDQFSDIVVVKLNEIEFESYVETDRWGKCLYSGKNV